MSQRREVRDRAEHGDGNAERVESERHRIEDQHENQRVERRTTSPAPLFGTSINHYRAGVRGLARPLQEMSRQAPQANASVAFRFHSAFAIPLIRAPRPWRHYALRRPSLCSVTKNAMSAKPGRQHETT
jgi:hypothetical protein